jgi:hypothetical protein
MLGTHNELHHLWRFSADNLSGRSFNAISAMTTTPNLTIEASKSPVVPLAPQSGAWHLAISRALLHLHLINA